MKAPVGATVKLTYDADRGVSMDANEYLRSPSGRSYFIVDGYRVVGKYPNRWRLTCLVIEQIPKRPGRKIHPIVFYARGKSQIRGR